MANHNPYCLILHRIDVDIPREQKLTDLFRKPIFKWQSVEYICIVFCNILGKTKNFEIPNNI